MDTHRLSRQASKYKEDRRTSSTVVLDTPMSASNRSSNSRSSRYSRRRSNPSAIPANCASGNCQNHLRSGKAGKAAWEVSVGPRTVLLQDMFHLRNGAKQRLARKLVGRLSMARTTRVPHVTLAHNRTGEGFRIAEGRRWGSVFPAVHERPNREYLTCSGASVRKAGETACGCSSACRHVPCVSRGPAVELW